MLQIRFTHKESLDPDKCMVPFLLCNVLHCSSCVRTVFALFLAGLFAIQIFYDAVLPALLFKFIFAINVLDFHPFSMESCMFHIACRCNHIWAEIPVYLCFLLYFLTGLFTCCVKLNLSFWFLIKASPSVSALQLKNMKIKSNKPISIF